MSRRASWQISAPAKVILSGEHAVVYGRPALAASLDLRACLLAVVGPASSDGRPSFVEFRFGDQLVCSWAESELADLLVRFSRIRRSPRRQVGSFSFDQLPEIGQLLRQFIPDQVKNNETPLATALAMFLLPYLDAAQFRGACRPATVSIRFEMPIGAGLGASGSAAVTFATFVAILFDYTSAVPLGESSIPVTETSYIDGSLIDSWAFAAEHIAHSKPSGIDNQLARSGGLLLFKRTDDAVHWERISAGQLERFRCLIVDSLVGRETQQLVGRVAGLRRQFPVLVDHVFSAIEQVTHQLHGVLSASSSSPPVDESEEAVFGKVKQLFETNHFLLSAIGVGHEKLNRIQEKAASLGCAAKLTGAGGGGCVLVLAPTDSVAGQLRSSLESLGFSVYSARFVRRGVEVLQMGQVSWRKLLEVLHHLQLCERAYWSLQFMSNYKWPVRGSGQKKPLLEVYGCLAGDVEQVSTTDELSRSFQLICSTLHGFLGARQRLIGVYVKLSTAADSLKTISDLVNCLPTGKIIVEDCQDVVSALQSLESFLMREVDIVRALLNTHLAVDELRFSNFGLLSALTSLYVAHNHLFQWQDQVELMRTRSFFSFISSSSSSSTPMLFSWLVKYRNFLLSKAGVYFFSSFVDYASSPTDLRNSLKISPSLDVIGRMSLMQKKYEIDHLVILCDTSEKRIDKLRFFMSPHVTPLDSSAEESAGVSEEHNIVALFCYPNNVAMDCYPELLTLSTNEPSGHTFDEKYIYHWHVLSRGIKAVAMQLYNSRRRAPHNRNAQLTTALNEFCLYLNGQSVFGELRSGVKL